MSFRKIFNDKEDKTNQTFPYDAKSIQELDELYKSFQVVILSSGHIVYTTSENTLFILDQFNLKEISSTALNINPDEEVFKLIESPKNQLQIILRSEDKKSIRIINYDVNDVTCPKKTRERRYDFSSPLWGIFSVNDSYVLSFEDRSEIFDDRSVELEDKKCFFSQALVISWRTLQEVIPISFTQFLGLSNNGSIDLWTKKGEHYHYTSENLSGDNMTHMAYTNGKIVCVDNVGRIHVYDLDERKYIKEIIPSHKTHKTFIYSIHAIDDILIFNTDDHVELWYLNQLDNTIDSIPYEDNLWGIVLLNKASIFSYNPLSNMMQLKEFPLMTAYRHDLDNAIAESQPALIKDLRKIVGEYTVDVSDIGLFSKKPVEPEIKVQEKKRTMCALL